MYNKAIKELEEEIKEREGLINKIKDFKNLDLSDKLQTLKKCTLRYEREVMPSIVQEDFKTDILRNGKANIGVNYFYIKNDTYTFYIGLFNRNIIEIENENRISNVSKYEYPKSYYDSKESILILDRFLENTTFKNYKEALSKIYKNTSRLYSLNYFINKKLAIKLVEERKRDLSAYISVQEKKFEEIKESLRKNEELKEKNENFLLSIKADLDYFKEKGYAINLRLEESNCSNAF